MRRYVVKIKRSSIRDNPEAGQTSFWQDMGSDTTIEIAGWHEPIEHDAVRMISRSEGSATYAVGLSGDDLRDLLEQLADRYGNKVRWTVTTRGQYVHSMTPAPDYLYDRESLTVECQHCLESFPHEQLTEDSYDDYTVKNICPSCGKPDACEVSYESVEEALGARG